MVGDNDDVPHTVDPESATKSPEDVGETKKVDTKVQETAAKEREKTGGYQ